MPARRTIAGGLQPSTTKATGVQKLSANDVQAIIDGIAKTYGTVR